MTWNLNTENLDSWPICDRWALAATLEDILRPKRTSCYLSTHLLFLRDPFVCRDPWFGNRGYKAFSERLTEYLRCDKKWIYQTQVWTCVWIQKIFLMCRRWRRLQDGQSSASQMRLNHHGANFRFELFFQLEYTNSDVKRNAVERGYNEFPPKLSDLFFSLGWSRMERLNPGWFGNFINYLLIQ